MVWTGIIREQHRRAGLRFPAARPGDRPRTTDLGEVVSAGAGAIVKAIRHRVPRLLVGVTNRQARAVKQRILARPPKGAGAILPRVRCRTSRR